MAGGTTSFLRIPGNIKREFTPFQLNPANKDLQKFSFKTSRPADVGRIHMVPASIELNTELFKYDISYSNQNISNLTFSQILNTLPCITIREYLPDTKLDQSLNFFSDLFSSIFKGKEKKLTEAAGAEVSNATSTEKKEKSMSLTDRLRNVLEQVMQYLDGDDFFDTLFKNTAGVKSFAGGEVDKKFRSVVQFPYYLYYNLQSCTTTSIYELPCVPSNNAMFTSDGMPGWTGNSGMRILPDFAKSIPILGKMLDSLFGNLGINFTPWWDASKGSETKAPEVEFKFSLFNDSAEAAVTNFVFINSLIANARWIQYGIMQHSSSLYDVAMAGIGKIYACTGNFSVQYKGTLRKPSTGVFNLLKKHVGSRFNDKIVNERLIKIPDVYDLTLKFQSVLPQNFNTFIYNYTQQDMMNMEQKDAVQESGFTGLTDAMKKLVKKTTEAWENAEKQQTYDAIKAKYGWGK